MRDSSTLSFEYETKSKSDSATFVGIASTSEVDYDDDVVENGAFDPILTKSVNGRVIPNVLLLRDHDLRQVIGGFTSIKQCNNGLEVAGEISLEVSKGRETYALMQKGFLNGLSCGFTAHRDSVVFSGRKRHIKKGVLHECSICAFPKNKNARIHTVKSVDEWLESRGFNPGDLEGLLRVAKKFESLNEDELELLERKSSMSPDKNVRVDAGIALQGVLSKLRGRYGQA